jgi:methyltransferase-like protein
MLLGNFPQEVADALMALTDDIVCMEQYMDFVRNRFFRQTLLAHDHLQLDRGLNVNHNIRQLFLRMKGAPERLPDTIDHTPLAFRTSQGSSFTTADPVVKAALLALFDGACALGFEALLIEAQKKLARPMTEKDAQHLEEALLAAYGVDLLECLLFPPRIQTDAAETPMALASARTYAKAGHAPPSLWHEPVVSDPLGLAVIALCNGQHDRADMVQRLAEQIRQGRFVVADDDNRPIQEEDILQPMLAKALDTILPALARMGMFKIP